MQNEEWRIVPSCPQYEVSDMGRVRRERYGKYHLLAGRENPAGYKRVAVSINGKVTPRYVHSLVMEAFVSERPAGMVINHKDGNRGNNCLDNLEYCTQKTNSQHARETARKVGKPTQHGNMLQVATSFTKDQYAHLRLSSSREKVSVSEYLRRLVDADAKSDALATPNN